MGFEVVVHVEGCVVFVGVEDCGVVDHFDDGWEVSGCVLGCGRWVDGLVCVGGVVVSCVYLLLQRKGRVMLRCCLCSRYCVPRREIDCGGGGADGGACGNSPH